MRRKELEEIGGFKSLANCLADDYQLGNRIFKNGHRIALCPVVVECWDAPMKWQRSLETSTPLGADHPRLPAAALFFQHSFQRNALAAALAFRFNCRDTNFLRAADRNCFFAFANRARAKSATPFHAGSKIGFSVLARASERFAASGNLVLRFCRQHRRVARPKNEIAPRRDFGRWWAMRDSNPRPSPCKGAALPLRQPPISEC